MTSRPRTRIAVITGAPAGLGPAVAQGLAKEGIWVGLNFRCDLDGAKRLADAIRSAGGRALLLPGDVTEPSQAWAVLERLDLEWGRPHLVIEQSGAENRAGQHVWPPIGSDRVSPFLRMACRALAQSPLGGLIVVGQDGPALAALTRPGDDQPDYWGIKTYAIPVAELTSVETTALQVMQCVRDVNRVSDQRCG